MAMYFSLDSFRSVLFYILTIRLGMTTTAMVADELLITGLDGLLDMFGTCGIDYARGRARSA